MWFIGVEVEQETSAPPPKKILDPPLEIPTKIKTLSYHKFKKEYKRILVSSQR